MPSNTQHVTIIAGTPPGPFPIVGVGFAPTHLALHTIATGDGRIETATANINGQNGGSFWTINTGESYAGTTGPLSISQFATGIQVLSWDPDGITLNINGIQANDLEMDFWFAA